jgi:hypothetical protein
MCEVPRDCAKRVRPVAIRIASQQYHLTAIAVSPEGAMDQNTQNDVEAAVFRRLVSHLRERTDVQNIDLMITAGFCRNCLGDWYREGARMKRGRWFTECRRRNGSACIKRKQRPSSRQPSPPHLQARWQARKNSSQKTHS